MKANAVRMEDFLAGNERHFLIPIYQRNYDWEKSQCEQLFNDVIAIGSAPQTVEKPQEHFIGSIVFILEGTYQTGITQLTIIDGQQRLTTLSLLYMALKEMYNKMGQAKDAEQIYNSYLINQYAADESKLKLRPTENNNQALKHLLSGKPTSEYPGYSPIIDNFIYFQSRINKGNYETLRKGLRGLMFVEISLDRDQDDPQRIFESLNSTGLALSQADLIRNYVLMDLKPTQQKKIYEQYWADIEELAKDDDNNEDRVSDLIRDFLTIQNNIIPTKKYVYRDFKKKYTERDFESITTILAQIKSLAKYYSNLLNPDKEQDSDIRRHLQYIQQLEINVSFPFLVQVYHDYGNSQISKSTFCNILALVQSFVWRRFIKDIPTNSLNKIFMTLYNRIDQTNYLKSVEQHLCSYTGSQRFPNDDEIREALRVKDMYNIRSKNRMYFLEHLANDSNNEPVQINGNPDITIEHVFPQNPDSCWKDNLSETEYREIREKYLHTIGNLTLSGNNGPLGNKCFIYKRDKPGVGYRDSRRLNQDLALLDTWDKEAIESRATRLIGRTLEIWKYPKDISSSKNTTQDEVNIFDAESPTDKKIDYMIFMDEKIAAQYAINYYQEILKLLVEQNPKAFLGTPLGNKIVLRKASDTSSSRRPIPLYDSYTIEGNVSAESIFNRLKYVLQSLGMEDALIVKYKE